MWVTVIKQMWSISYRSTIKILHQENKYATKRDNKNNNSYHLEAHQQSLSFIFGCLSYLIQCMTKQCILIHTLTILSSVSSIIHVITSIYFSPITVVSVSLTIPDVSAFPVTLSQIGMFIWKYFILLSKDQSCLLLHNRWSSRQSHYPNFTPRKRC